MSETSARFGLPFILPGQAQKELFHNEALAIIDVLLHPVVEGEQAAPPNSPILGQAWIVGEAASGAWAGKVSSIAGWTTGGWRFAVPRVGMGLWDIASGHMRIFDGSAWSGALKVAEVWIGGERVLSERQPAVPSPSGGTTIDIEARAAIDGLTAALLSHGLIG